MTRRTPHVSALSRPRPALMVAILCLGAASGAGCQPAGAQPASAFPPDTSASERQYGSAVTVGLRVALDPRSPDEPHVHVSAVVRDLDGAVENYDIGDYQGTARQQPVQGDELLRVHLDHSHGSTLVVRIGPDGQLEVHYQPDEGEDTTVRRIPLRDGARVRASDPPVETE